MGGGKVISVTILTTKGRKGLQKAGTHTGLDPTAREPADIDGARKTGTTGLRLDQHHVVPTPPDGRGLPASSMIRTNEQDRSAGEEAGERIRAAQREQRDRSVTNHRGAHQRPHQNLPAHESGPGQDGVLEPQMEVTGEQDPGQPESQENRHQEPAAAHDEAAPLPTDQYGKRRRPRTKRRN